MGGSIVIGWVAIEVLWVGNGRMTFRGLESERRWSRVGGGCCN